MSIILLIFLSLLGYEVYCRYKETNKKETTILNPYNNTKWFINGKRIVKDNSISHKKKN